MATADWAAATVWQILRDSATRPVALSLDRILLQELLPQGPEPSDYPALGIYLVEDQPLADTGQGLSNRSATIHVEIRALIPDGQTALSATQPYRAWALRELLPNQERDSGIEGAEFLAFKPFGIAGQQRVAGALLEISIPFFFDPEEP